MDGVTFKKRHRFLNEFYSKDRVHFSSALKYIAIGDFSARNRITNNMFFIDTEAAFRKSFINSHIPFGNYYNLLKPLIYFLYSFTRQEKFLNDYILYLSSLRITFYINNIPEEDDFKADLYFPTLSRVNGDVNFLNKIKINYFTKGINEITINLLSHYRNININQYYRLGGAIMFPEPIPNYDPAPEEELEPLEFFETGEDEIINSSKCFKYEECLICATNPPNVLFCNCGHICYCSECEKLRKSNKCPICKNENKIIRVLE